MRIWLYSVWASRPRRVSNTATPVSSQDVSIPSTGPFTPSTFAISLAFTIKCAARPVQRVIVYQWSDHAQRQSSRELAFRVRAAPFQAYLRKGRRSGRDPKARVLRNADAGAHAK